MAQKTTLKEFESIFPKLEEVLLEHAKSYNLPQAELDWYKQVRSFVSLGQCLCCLVLIPHHDLHGCGRDISSGRACTIRLGSLPLALANTFCFLFPESPGQHARRKMQPRYVRPRLGVGHPRQAPL